MSFVASLELLFKFAFEHFTGHLDLVLAPGLAFTKTGVRLGRGKGYYDKFLAKCFQEFKVEPATIALAFKEQIVDEIPKTETDVLMDQVVYEES